MQQDELLNADGLVSLKPLKEFAKDMLPQSSMLRQLILIEPDLVPCNQYIEKTILYRRLLMKELQK